MIPMARTLVIWWTRRVSEIVEKQSILIKEELKCRESVPGVNTQNHCKARFGCFDLHHFLLNLKGKKTLHLPR